MSTRCRIGIENSDGTVLSVYCHYDGQIVNGVGEQLCDWDNESEIRQMLEKGDMSNFGEPYGDPDSKAVKHANVNDYFKYSKESFVDYVYLFKKGQWVVSKTIEDNGEELKTPVFINISDCLRDDCKEVKYAFLFCPEGDGEGEIIKILDTKEQAVKEAEDFIKNAKPDMDECDTVAVDEYGKRESSNEILWCLCEYNQQTRDSEWDYAYGNVFVRRIYASKRDIDALNKMTKFCDKDALTECLGNEDFNIDRDW